MSQRKRTILLYGRTGSGKTSQLGELAEHVKLTTGKKSLVYTIDKGGIGPLLGLQEVGIIDVVAQEETDPFMFLAKASRGEVRKDGKWVKANLDEYGLVAYESFTGFGDALMNNLAEKAAQGINIGGQANISFNINSDGETMKVGGSNMAHYGVCQTRMLDEFWRSQKLPVSFVIWTAGVSKEDDTTSTTKVIGPAGPGKALTPELPRHVDLCLRIDNIPAQSGKPERHIIYLGSSIDINAGNAMALGNTRVPMGAQLPATVEPASIVNVLKLISEAEVKAKEDLQKRLNLTNAK